MMHNTVQDIRDYFKGELAAENFTIDRTGAKTIELLGAQFIADEPAIFGEVNKDYVRKEIAWYNSQSTNVNDIEGKVPAAWVYTANDHGEINSNYGHLIHSAKYFNQFLHAKTELVKNPDSRRAIMVYNRPSIWKEFNENGKNDMICTNAHTYYIRDGKLDVVVQMRSNDVIFGYKNDYAWAEYVLKLMARDLEVEVGKIYWQVQNLHVYEKHFGLVE